MVKSATWRWCEATASESCFEPVSLLFVGYIGEHARCSVAVIAGDNQASTRSHALNHLPKRIGSQLVLSFLTEFLKTISWLCKLVDTLVWPVMPKDNVRCGTNPVEAIIPSGAEGFSPRTWKVV